MKRVNWSSKSEYQHLANFKLLMNGFKKKGVQKNIPIEKLVKMKYQDNLELIQWFKKHFDDSWDGRPSTDYNALTRRHNKIFISPLTKRTRVQSRRS